MVTLYDQLNNQWVYVDPDGSRIFVYAPDAATAMAEVQAYQASLVATLPDEAMELANGLVSDGVITQQQEQAIFPPSSASGQAQKGV